MPSNYDGSPTGHTPREQITIAVPVDADPRNAASVVVPMETLADFVAYLQSRVALLDVAYTSNAGPIAGNLTTQGYIATKDRFKTLAPGATEYKECGYFPGGAGSAGLPAGRIFIKGGGAGDPLLFVLTNNAKRNGTDTAWERDDADFGASMVTLGADGTVMVDIWPTGGAGFTVGAILTELDGHMTIEGSPNLRLLSLIAPTLDGDAATKAYVVSRTPNSVAAGPNTLALRDEGGRMESSAPVAPEDVTTKLYVDTGFMDRDTPSDLHYMSVVGGFLNSWESYDSGTHRAGYWKDHHGTVHFFGAVKLGPTPGASTIFGMPAGYRSTRVSYFVCANIGSDGAKIAIAGFDPVTNCIACVANDNNELLDLSAISYLADA